MWKRATRDVVWLVLLVVGLSLMAVSASPNEADAPAPIAGIDYETTGAGTLLGADSATCDAIRFAGAAGAPLVIDIPTPATLSITTVRYNLTYVGGVLVDAMFRAYGHADSFSLVPGEYRAAGGATGPVVYPDPLQSDADARFEVRLGDEIAWAHAGRLPIGPTYWQPDTEDTFAAGVAGDHIRVQGYGAFGAVLVTPGGAAGAIAMGDFHVFMSEGRIHGPDGSQWDIGPARQVVSDVSDPTGNVVTREIRETFATVHVTEGTAGFDGSDYEAICTGLAATGVDELARTRTTGDLHSASGMMAFANRVLIAGGDMTLSERIDDDGTAHGQVSGAVTAFGLDFHVVTIGGLAPEARRAAAIGAGIVGGLAALRLAFLFWPVLYSRLKEDELLDHPRRALLNDYVAANPACTLQDVARETGISRSVLRHHLAVLEAAGLMRRHRVQGEAVLTVRGHQIDPVAMRLVDSKPPLRALVDATRRAPVARGALVSQLVSRFGLTRRSARRWIQRAVEMRILAETGPQGPDQEVRYRCDA